MKKIAVASEDLMVTEHFGHCKNFHLYEVEGKSILKHQSIPNPEHRPGFLPNFLGDLGVNVIIAGGMGQGATDIFKQRSIEVFTGIQGEAKTAVEAYLSGNLKSSGEICHHHHDRHHAND